MLRVLIEVIVLVVDIVTLLDLDFCADLAKEVVSLF